MSRFGDFEVVRTARLKCKRSNDPNADEDGMREYAYLKCPHCKTEDIEIASSNLKAQKSTVMKDHIAKCPSYTGERPTKRGKSTATNELSVFKAEWEEMKRKNMENDSLKAEMEEMKRKNLENDSLRAEVAELKLAMENQEQAQQQAMEVQQQEIKELQSKTNLYDNVLASVMPSLVLPLTAPEKLAELCLREAAIKDIRPAALASSHPGNVVTREMHDAMIEQKDALIAAEKAHKEESLGTFKAQLETKERELSKLEKQKADAEQKRNEAEQERREAELKKDEAVKELLATNAHLSKLQRERDVLKSKYAESIKGKAGHSNETVTTSTHPWMSPDPNRARARETAEARRAEQEFAQKRARMS